MSSAGPSPSGPPANVVPAGVLSGPVAVCVDRPLLALDRPFTYDLAAELRAGVGSLVRVRFHGKLVKGWVLGATEDVPRRVLPVHDVVSPVRFFDPSLLDVHRALAERYVAPLAAMIDRSVPPRVAAEDAIGGRVGSSDPTSAPAGTALDAYRGGDDLRSALAAPAGDTFVVRSVPGAEAALAVDVAASAVRAGRTAIVVVPEVDPLPVTVRALVDAFGDDVACWFGLGKRARYRMWLAIARGDHRVVVGTRAAVLAPVPRLGAIHVTREHHALHREERSPSTHAREVAATRARVQGAVCVLSSVMPSIHALAMPHARIEPRRRSWPPVEVVKPGPEGRAPRLVRALREARRGFLFEPMRGYGVARVCRACGEPAACATCGGVLRSEGGAVRCAVCEAPGRCATCGAADFGLARGGAERVEEWAAGVARSPVALVGPDDVPRAVGDDEIVVGGIDAVKDLGTGRLDVVGILHADASLRRPGVDARSRALAAWAEVAAWAVPGGRVIVQTDEANDHAVQALVTGNPDRFARVEAPRLERAGFPPGAPVFRVAGTEELEAALASTPHRTMIATSLGGQTVSLVALDLGDVATFGAEVRRLAERGVVTRVEAEPHL